MRRSGGRGRGAPATQQQRSLPPFGALSLLLPRALHRVPQVLGEQLEDVADRLLTETSATVLKHADERPNAVVAFDIERRDGQQQLSRVMFGVRSSVPRRRADRGEGEELLQLLLRFGISDRPLVAGKALHPAPKDLRSIARAYGNAHIAEQPAPAVCVDREVTLQQRQRGPHATRRAGSA